MTHFPFVWGGSYSHSLYHNSDRPVIQVLGRTIHVFEGCLRPVPGACSIQWSASRCVFHQGTGGNENGFESHNDPLESSWSSPWVRFDRCLFDMQGNSWIPDQFEMAHSDWCTSCCPLCPRGLSGWCLQILVVLWRQVINCSYISSTRLLSSAHMQSPRYLESIVQFQWLHLPSSFGPTYDSNQVQLVCQYPWRSIDSKGFRKNRWLRLFCRRDFESLNWL